MKRSRQCVFATASAALMTVALGACEELEEKICDALGTRTNTIITQLIAEDPDCVGPGFEWTNEDVGVCYNTDKQQVQWVCRDCVDKNVKACSLTNAETRSISLDMDLASVGLNVTAQVTVTGDATYECDGVQGLLNASDRTGHDDEKEWISATRLCGGELSVKHAISFAAGIPEEFKAGVNFTDECKLTKSDINFRKVDTSPKEDCGGGGNTSTSSGSGGEGATSGEGGGGGTGATGGTGGSGGTGATGGTGGSGGTGAYGS